MNGLKSNVALKLLGLSTIPLSSRKVTASEMCIMDGWTSKARWTDEMVQLPRLIVRAKIFNILYVYAISVGNCVLDSWDTDNWV